MDKDTSKHKLGSTNNCGYPSLLGRRRQTEETSITTEMDMKKKKKVLPHLPDDLIVLILMRLPVESLLRFKFVSKFFFSLISNTQFAKQHFDLAASPTHRLFYLPGNDYASLSWSIDFDDDSAFAVALIPPILPFRCNNPRIMGSCNGFILLGNHYNLFIWNPTTGAHKKLPMPKTPSFDIIRQRPIVYGFGYDASKDDYLVFEASCALTVKGVWKNDFKLFSLRANAWNTVEGNGLPYLNFFDKAGILLNGVLHWLPHRRDTNTRVILAFDLKEKSFSEVPLPPDFFKKYAGYRSDLCVLDGKLSLYVPGKNATEIWVMNEYKVSSSWKKTVELCMTSEANPNLWWWRGKHYFSPRYSTKYGDIVGVNGAARVVKFNAKGQLLEHYADDLDPRTYICEAIMYTESLLSFPS